MTSFRELAARLAPWGILPVTILWVLLGIGFSFDALAKSVPTDFSLTARLISFFNHLPDGFYMALLLCAICLQTFVLLGRWPCWLASLGALLLFLLALDPGCVLWLCQHFGARGIRYDFAEDPDGLTDIFRNALTLTFVIAVILSLGVRGILFLLARRSARIHIADVR